MADLKELYKQKCSELGIKPNSKLVGNLPSSGGLQTLDLTDNMIGSKGVLAILPVVEHSPELATICLRGNMIASGTIKDLATTLREHKTVHSLDLSDNDIRLAGPDLLELLKHNRNICDVNIADTHLRPLFVNLITLQLKKNKGEPTPPEATPPAAAAAAEAPPPDEEAPQPPAEQPAGEPAPSDPPAPAEPATAEAPPASPPAVKTQDTPAPAAEETPPAPEATTGQDSPPQTSPQTSPRGNFGTFGDFNEIFSTEHAEPSFTEETEQLPATQSRPSSSGGGLTGGHVKPRRATVCAEAYSEAQIDDFKPEVYKKDEETQNFLLHALEQNQLLNHLDDYEHQVLVDAVKEVTVKEGECIYNEDEADMDESFIVKTGEVSIWMKDVEKERIGVSKFVGEVFLLYPQIANETAKAEKDCVLYSINRKTFKFILQQASKKKRAMYEGFLMRVPFLSTLQKNEILQLADALKSCSYEDGQGLINYGEVGDWLHIVVEGTVKVVGRNETGDKVDVCTFTVGDCVGELEFLNHHKCVADVLADGKYVTLPQNARTTHLLTGCARRR